MRSILLLAISCLCIDTGLAATSSSDHLPGHLPGQHNVDWPVHGGTPFEQRFSPLSQINTDTVDQLELAWVLPTGNQRGMEATPIVVDGRMYISTAWSRVIAMEAKTGRELWRFDPKVPGPAARNACCDVVNRGVAVWRDLVIVGTIDGRLVAVNKDTGLEVWSTQTTDPNQPYTITGAPRVVGDKVIIGNGGAEFGVRGYFGAYAAATGEQVWRFYTVPGSADGPVEHPELEMARRTWSPDSLWEAGLGGTVWDAFAFDPKLNLLYVGVGNSSVYNRAIRSPGGGDNLFLTSILALNPDTGALVWHYQTTPAESWDYTATQHMILADLEHFGETRQVLMQAPKNGFFYVLDRATGELLSAKNYVPVNWASHIDLETGRPVETGEGDWSQEQKLVTPGPFGGHNWHPMAYSPNSGLVYIPTNHGAYPFTPDPNFKYTPGRMNTGEDWPELAKTVPPVRVEICSATRLTAWHPTEQRLVWEARFDSGSNAGLLATAGGLVFRGTTEGEFQAYDQDDGRLLWSRPTGVGIMAAPVSFAIDGEQYVSVVAGIGGAQGTLGTELKRANLGHVFTFKLHGQATLPEIPARAVAINESALTQANPDLSDADVERGQALYAYHCLRCHGVNAASSGVYPDLRGASVAVHQNWQAIVLDGVLENAGMAGFADVLSAQDSQDLHAYVIDQTLTSTTWGNQLLQAAAGAICIPSSWMTP